MLYHIVNADDKQFEQYMGCVRRAYWPEHKFKETLKSHPGNKAKPEDIYRALSSSPLYEQFSFDENNRPNVKYRNFPFLDRFYEYFLCRHWNLPDSLSDTPGQVNLYPSSSNNNVSGGVINYSEHHGDYNHFVNVIAALARLIAYFRNSDNVELLWAGEGSKSQRNPLYIDIAYQIGANDIAYQTDPGEYPNKRTFLLMVAAFYHDIGKTIVNARHGMEGRLILGFHTSDSRYLLNEIAGQYNDQHEIERDDILFIADLINFHDSYGTLATGEDGYDQLVGIVDVIKRYSINFASRNSKSNPELERIKWSYRNLFDLWLLNVADIICSLDDKYKLQNGNESKQETKSINWMNKNDAEASIEAFLGSYKGAPLVHDLKITFDLLSKINETKHSDDISFVSESALNYSRRHVVERVRRLVRACLKRPLSSYQSKQKLLDISEGNKSGTPELRKAETLIKHIRELSESDWESSIVRSIQSNGDFHAFCNRLAKVGKMDYSLGFFAQIAEGAIRTVAEAILNNERNTGWTSNKDIEHYGGDEEYLCNTNAKIFADNFVSIVVQILGYILFRRPDNDNSFNLEFIDASDRLTEEKVRKILSREGPFRSRRTTQLILETISMY